MEKLKYKLFSATLGASSGLAGLFTLSRCSGSACNTCFRCAGAGMGIFLIMLLNKVKKSREF